MKRPQIVAYPYLFAISPLLSLYSEDFLYTHLTDTLRGTLLVMLGTWVLLRLTGLYTGDKHRAGVAALSSVIALATFGRALIIVAQLTSANLGRWCYGLVLFAWMLLAVGATARARTTQWRLEKATPVLNLLGVAMVLAGSLRLASQEIELTRAWAGRSWLGSGLSEQLTAQGSVPDIYYIVLDSYPGHEVLKDTFDYDNFQLREYLGNKGFYLADQSRSNYSQTSLSLASSMNMTYLDTLVSDTGEHSSDRMPLARLVRHSEVRSGLESLGYQVVSFETGYRVTEMPDAWLYSSPSHEGMTRFERNALVLSALRIPLDLSAGLRSPVEELSYRGHRQRVLHALSKVGTEPDNAQPVFVFMHVVFPHPPFVFDDAGEPVTPPYYCTLAEGSHYPGPRDQYISSYRKQITYLDGLLVQAIERILQRSQDPPVIIVQSDHGSGYGLVWHSIENSDRLERLSILNAYLMPRASDRLYSSISPVNTFRLLFSSYFGAELSLLPDVSFMSTWERPYEFVQVESDGSIVQPSHVP